MELLHTHIFELVELEEPDGTRRKVWLNTPYAVTETPEALRQTFKRLDSDDPNGPFEVRAFLTLAGMRLYPDCDDCEANVSWTCGCSHAHKTPHAAQICKRGSELMVSVNAAPPRSLTELEKQVLESDGVFELDVI